MKSLTLNEFSKVEGKTIYCHPNIYDKLRHKIDCLSINSRNYNFTSIYGFKILPSRYIPEKKWTKKWLRTNVLPDDKYTEWVDINNPSDWAIRLGLVKKEMVDCFWVVSPKMAYMSYDFPQIKEPRCLIKSGF